MGARRHSTSATEETVAWISALVALPITLDSRFVEHDQPVLLTGIQALVRLLLEQAALDRAAGLHTAGLASGYRGSPLGGLDHELWRQQQKLAEHDIRFEPGVNEDLAASMLFGTQQLDVFPGARFDGVFGLWYAKGPGVDRSGDALHCANMTGTHKHGGVMAVAGDDHGAHSSTYPHQTEYMFQNVFMPVLNPANVQDILELGPGRLRAVALLRVVDRAEDHRGNGGAGRDLRHPLPPPLHHARFPDPAARAEPGPEAALPRRPHGDGAAGDRRTPARRAGLGARQPAGPAGVRRRRRADRPDHRRQGA